MQPIISLRFESSFDGKPWPPEYQPDYTIPIIMISVFYTVGFLMCIFTLGTLEKQPWIPARVRRDACLMPLFFVLPAFFWPLAFAMIPLTFIFYFLKGAVYMVRYLVGSATTCCGIPLPGWWPGLFGNVEATSSPEADLEMGPLVAAAEDDGEGESGGGKDDSDPAAVRSAGSGESERPPPYTSLALDQDEDDSGEADGLLAKRTDG